MMRGIFMTFIVILIFSAILFYSFEVTSLYKDRYTLATSNSYYSGTYHHYDDVGTDAADIYGLEFSQNLLQNGTQYKFDFAQSAAVNDSVADYTSYTNETFAERMQKNITTSFSSQSLNITCGDGVFVRRNFTSGDTYIYLNTSSLSNASISVVVGTSLASSSAWSNNASGVPVSLKVVSGGTSNVNTVFTLSKSTLNRYTLNYTSQALYIDFGSVGAGTEGIRIWGTKPYAANITVVQNSTYSDGSPCYFTNSNLTLGSLMINSTGPIPVPTHR